MKRSVHRILAVGLSVLLLCSLHPPTAAAASVTGCQKVVTCSTHTAALTSSGELYVWGTNHSGQFLMTPDSHYYSYTPLKSATRVVDVDVSPSCTLVVYDDGSLMLYGRDPYSSELYDAYGTQIDTDVAKVAAGTNYVIYLKQDGTVWGWGANSSGQLGTGGTTAKASPVRITGRIRDISVGQEFVLALGENDTLYGWGRNNFYQLAQGTPPDELDDVSQVTATVLIPKPIATDVAAISAGDHHTCMIKTDGTLWTLGNDDFGQLGTGSGSEALGPTLILSDVASVSAGALHTFAVLNDGSVYGWGQNISGQLGTGDSQNHSVPYLLKNTNGYSSVFTDDNTTFAVSADGSLWGWGSNLNYILAAPDDGSYFNAKWIADSSMNPVQPDNPDPDNPDPDNPDPDNPDPDNPDPDNPDPDNPDPDNPDPDNPDPDNPDPDHPDPDHPDPEDPVGPPPPEMTTTTVTTPSGLQLITTTPATPENGGVASLIATVKATVAENGAASAAVTTEDMESIIENSNRISAAEVSIHVASTGLSGAPSVSLTLPSASLPALTARQGTRLILDTPIAGLRVSARELSDAASGSTSITLTAAKTSGDSYTISLSKGAAALPSLPGGITAMIHGVPSPGMVACLVTSDGVQRITKSVLIDGTMFVPLLAPGTVRLEDRQVDFIDVAESNWASDYIDFVSSRGLFLGTSGDTFSPSQPMTRSMLAAVLYRLEDSPSVTVEMVFPDVGPNSWYTAAVSWAEQAGIVAGSSGSFGPERSISRQELAVMLYRYAQVLGTDTASRPETLSYFRDGSAVASWSASAMAWAVESGIIGGKTGGRLAPSDYASRAEVAAMVQRFAAYLAQQ